ncbi:hypothetical protein Syun_011245 [Stephania yunnanensis]|uniref:Uncharacterized protein n=1 Tax=Stephania yunnanensis TaxID=152371 RepID=A0AAP0JY72_9MAGN
MKKKKKGHGEHGTSSKKSFHRKDLCRRAMICKRIYETEFNQAEDDSTTTKKKKKKKGHGEHRTSS